MLRRGRWFTGVLVAIVAVSTARPAGAQIAVALVGATGAVGAHTGFAGCDFSQPQCKVATNSRTGFQLTLKMTMGGDGFGKPDRSVKSGGSAKRDGFAKRGGSAPGDRFGSQGRD